jgi:hypothetical protein
MKFLNIVVPAAAALLLGIVTPTKAADVQVNSNEANAISGSAAFSSTESASKATALQGNAQNINFNNPGVIQYQGGYDVKSVPGIVAPALTTTLTETCMGSTSVGGAVLGFGITVGSTWKDEECVRRLHAREVSALGEKDVAKEVLCGSPIVAAAYAAVGRPCKLATSSNTGIGGVITDDRKPMVSPQPAKTSEGPQNLANACAINKADADRLGLQVCR